ncbi:MAG: alpha/beta fold hydrolase [Cyclobacteriaceae bacterium]
MKKVWLIIPAALLIAYLLGPQIPPPSEGIDLPEISSDLHELESIINDAEDTVAGLKPDNRARIIWYDSVRRTPYVFVYLHGWSASYREGDPLHKELAHRYGANLYLPRLYGHGIDTGDNNFADLTADKLIRSAKEAIAVSTHLGDSVIIIGTSTGGTLGLYLANSSPSISSLILYSPNVRIFDKSSVILDDPWGIQIGELVTGSPYYEWQAEGPRKQYWTTRYRLESLGQLQALVEYTMRPEVFHGIKKPVFTGCFYKDDAVQDHTVSVDAIVEMYDQLGSSSKELVKFPNVGHHVIASSLTSEDLASVRNETTKFLEEIIGLKPVINPQAAGAMKNDGMAPIQF